MRLLYHTSGANTNLIPPAPALHLGLWLCCSLVGHHARPLLHLHHGRSTARATYSYKAAYISQTACTNWESPSSCSVALPPPHTKIYKTNISNRKGFHIEYINCLIILCMIFLPCSKMAITSLILNSRPLFSIFRYQL